MHSLLLASVNKSFRYFPFHRFGVSVAYVYWRFWVHYYFLSKEPLDDALCSLGFSSCLFFVLFSCIGSISANSSFSPVYTYIPLESMYEVLHLQSNLPVIALLRMEICGTSLNITPLCALLHTLSPHSST